MRQGDQRMELKETIYEILLGQSLLSAEQEEVHMQIEDLFEGDSECSRLYEAVYQANREICKKLGVEESKEVETIIGNLDEIQRIVAMKMYDYGYQAAKNEESKKVF